MTQYIKTIALFSLACLTALSAFGDEEKETPLAKEMSAMNKPYRSLSKAFRKAPNPDNKAEYISQVETMLKHAKASVDYIPALAETLPAEGKTKMTAEYKAAMKKSIQTIEQLLAALKTENYDTATELLAKLKKQKSAGHDKFQAEDE